MEPSDTRGPDPAASPAQQPPFSHHQPPMSPPHPLVSTLGWDIKSILDFSPNFHALRRVHYSSPNAKVDVILPEVERDGCPRIIYGWNRHPKWPKALFSLDWLKLNGDQNPTVRNVHSWADFKIGMADFVQRLHDTPIYAAPDEQERLYGKDGDCPAEWIEWLARSGALPEELLFHGSNDFLKFLPDKAKVQTLMCYTGVGDTFTPFHKDLCASTGQNLMCFSEHSGSAFWFMTEASASPQVAAYFHQLGQEVDLETHVVTLEQLAKAPFNVYIAEQLLGDLVLVPPRSYHQVVNKGGITIKTSWSRMSLGGLEAALWHELPIYHRVCRQEIYKVKSNIFHALQYFTRDLLEPRDSSPCSTSTENLKQLVCLFDDILTSEFSLSRDSMPHVSYSRPHTDDLHCDFCGADIFQSFFECDSCLPASSSSLSADVLLVGDGLVLCPLCYVEGRSCQCGMMEPVQCRPFDDLLEIRDQALKAIQHIDNHYNNPHGYLSEQPHQLLSERGGNVFEAACKLFQKRLLDAKATRSCRARQSHQVPASAAIYCRPCHFSKCYTHMLEMDSVHSVDAIALSERHDGDMNWHQFHRNSSQQYQELRRRVIEDEEKGSRPNASHRLIYLAKTFTACRAIAPEVTRHGWYDRFAQMTTAPIMNSPPKVLVGLPVEDHGDGPCDSHDPPSSNLAAPTMKGSDLQTDSRQTLTPPEDTDDFQTPRESTPSVVPSSCSPVVDSTPPTLELDTLRTLGATRAEHDTANGPLSAPCLSSSTKQPPPVLSPSFLVVDDPGNLSDLTDLPTDVDSPTTSSIIPLPAIETSDEHLFTELTLSPPLVQVTSLGPKLRSKLVFDCVEIARPKRHNGKKEKVSSTPLRKRKRSAASPCPPAESDDSSSSAEEISCQLLSKRKMSRGAASRPRLPSLSVRDPPLPYNILASALNQTFQLNGTSASSGVPTTPPSDETTLNGGVINKLGVKPQYRDVGVQKDINFVRCAPTVQPSEDLSSCITRLQTEIRDLRAQAEIFKRERDECRESLDEINKLYNSRPPPPSTPPPVSPPLPLPPARAGISSNFNSRPFPEFSTHPRWRTCNIGTNNWSRPADTQDYPPIETLHPHTPSSRSASMSPHRRTPTEPWSLRMQTRGDFHSNRGKPYYRHQQRGRRRGPPDSMNGRRREGKPHGRSSFVRRESAADVPSLPNSSAEDIGTFGTLSRIDDAEAEAVAQDLDHDRDDGW